MVSLIIRWLKYFNYFFGICLLIAGLYGFLFRNSITALLLALALAVVGPIEDILNKKLRLPNVDPAQTKELVNQSTSLLFIIILLVVILLSIGVF
jgi:hypothetical protein